MVLILKSYPLLEDLTRSVNVSVLVGVLVTGDLQQNFVINLTETSYNIIYWYCILKLYYLLHTLSGGGGCLSSFAILADCSGSSAKGEVTQNRFTKMPQHDIIPCCFAARKRCLPCLRIPFDSSLGCGSAVLT